MKANEFVKKFGWSSLKIAIRLPQFKRYKYVIFYSDEIDFKNEFDEHYKDYMFETSEIKQLIEAKELVDYHEGIAVDLLPSYVLDAIQLVESCQ